MHVFLFYLEAEKQSRMAALLERLHAKHNASRPWQETCKVVRQAMVRERPFYKLFVQISKALFYISKGRKEASAARSL